MEYCLKVEHCSGISWTTWRRFSDFHHAHEAFESEKMCARIIGVCGGACARYAFRVTSSIGLA